MTNQNYTMSSYSNYNDALRNLIRIKNLAVVLLVKTAEYPMHTVSEYTELETYMRIERVVWKNLYQNINLKYIVISE